MHFRLTKRNRCPKETRISKTGQVSVKNAHISALERKPVTLDFFVTFRKDSLRSETRKCGFDNWVQNTETGPEKGKGKTAVNLVSLSRYELQNINNISKGSILVPPVGLGDVTFPSR
ncbi:hypothetical protein AVEN_191474-1 [Araneus ventricosus]|uniref:Uncharacterized protein n=1 Tax=Araneus ventricosus TaxID=182803 RepID=A0A4Y2T4K0_ARAVE|nr:hypothetical protein AVEN_191474-1 [Araneus ventricosus]